MSHAQAVVRAIATAERCIPSAPVLAIRMARANLDCRDFVDAYRGHANGHPTRFGAYLDSPNTGRAARKRHDANKRARRARKANRR